MNPVVPRNILFLTMMLIVCFFPCSMATVYPSTSMKYEIGDDVSCGAGLDQVCCPVGIGATDTDGEIKGGNEAENDPGRPGCLCRCAVLPIDAKGVDIETAVPVAAYCQVGQGGWVPPPTEASGGAKKPAKKYKKL